MKKTICIYFDGVLHSYESGWKGPLEITDGPVDGAVDFCRALVKKFKVVVLSTRCQYEGGASAIQRWLVENGFPDDIHVSFDGAKVPAWLYIDDRAFCFQGTFPTIDEIESFKPWNKK